MRLNGWQCIGIVLSVIWAVAMVLEMGNDSYEQANSVSITTAAKCESEQRLQKNSNLEVCEQIKKAAFDRTKEKYNYVGGVGLLILAPIAFAWFAVYLLMWVLRWVKTGFKNESAKPDD
jgi:hypothetical protein